MSASVFFSAGFLPLLAADDVADKFEPIKFDLNIFVFTWIVFGVVIMILGKFAWRPLLAKLDEREHRIASGLEEAEKAREEARRVTEEFASKVKEAQIEAQRIAAEARSSAERMASGIESKARERASKLVENARAEVAAAQRQAIEEVRRIAVDLSLTAAEAVVRQTVDEGRNRELAAKVIQEVGSGGNA